MRRMTLVLGLALVLVAAACGRNGKGIAEPKLPRPEPVAVPGPVTGSEPGVDWSFLGAADPQLVSAQVLHLAPFVAQGNLADDEDNLAPRRGEALKAWVEEHVKIAGRGSAGVVHLVFTQCVGWGSMVPSDYTLFGCFTPFALFAHAAGEPGFVKACRACSREDETCMQTWCAPRLVEGYFTGKTKIERQDPDDPASARVSYEVRVLRDRPLTGPPVEATELAPDLGLVLPAGSPQPDGPTVSDGPRFAVAARVDRVWAPTSLTLARELASKLHREGFTDAQVIDSRRIRTQWCCSHLVIAARVGTTAEAERVRTSLATKNLANFEVVELY